MARVTLSGQHRIRPAGAWLTVCRHASIEFILQFLLVACRKLRINQEELKLQDRHQLLVYGD